MAAQNGSSVFCAGCAYNSHCYLEVVHCAVVVRSRKTTVRAWKVALSKGRPPIHSPSPLTDVEPHRSQQVEVERGVGATSSVPVNTGAAHRQALVAVRLLQARWCAARQAAARASRRWAVPGCSASILLLSACCNFFDPIEFASSFVSLYVPAHTYKERCASLNRSPPSLHLNLGRSCSEPHCPLRP